MKGKLLFWCMFCFTTCIWGNEDLNKPQAHHLRGGKKRILTILGLFELTRNHLPSSNGQSEKFAAEIAIQDVNEYQGVLDGYTLQMHTNDTQCDSGAGVDAFFHALYMKKEFQIISLLGSACSEVTERLAKIVTYWNIVQVSFGSTSPTLSDRKKFPLFYRTIAPVSSYYEAIIEFCKLFNWDTVTFFTKNENQYTLPVNFMVTELELNNITCKETLTFSLSDVQMQLQELKESDSRIIIASFGLDIAPIIFCEVYHMRMFGSDYAWIWLLESNLVKNFWSNLTTIDNNQSFSTTQNQTCSQIQLARAIEHIILVYRYNMDHHSDSDMLPTYSPMSPEDFLAKLKSKNISELSPYAPFSYDAVWAIALGLEKIRSNPKISLDNFQYNNSYFSDQFIRAIGSLNFNGISGPLFFSGSDRIGITSFMQIQEGELYQIGLFYPRESHLNLTCAECHGIKWHGNQVPISRREFRFKRIEVDITIYIIIGSIATFGILLAFIFLAFNLYNRKLKYIKLSSPRLNNIVIIGAIFAYTGVLLLGSNFGPEPDGKHFAYICTIRAYLLSMGFSLAFGAVFAKTYRVHRIFTRRCLGIVKNKLLRDNQLLLLISVLLLIDCIIISTWAIFDPMHRNLRNLTIEIDPNDRSVVYQPQIEVCESKRGNVWLSILYGYKSLLLSLGLYMAWETRHVKVQALNDSKYIGICVYVVVITSVLGVSLVNLISDRVTLAFITITILILTSTTSTLCLLFLPKIFAIITHAVGGIESSVVESSGLKIEFNTRRFMVEDKKELLFRAEVQNRVFKRQIVIIDFEIRRLEELLRISSSPASINKPMIQQIKQREIMPKIERGPSTEKLYRNTRQRSNSLLSTSSKSSAGTPDESEIYTIYLHGPKFIIPISLFNKNDGLLSDKPLPLSSIKDTLKLPLTSTPRSSWPNENSNTNQDVQELLKLKLLKSVDKSLTNSNKKYLYQSEPKLLALNNWSKNDLHQQMCRNDLNLNTSRNNNSNSGSDINTNTNTNRRQSKGMFNVFKIPINYLSGFLRSSDSNNLNEKNCNLTQINSASTETTTNVNSKSNKIVNKKYLYNSVPNLWTITPRSPHTGLDHHRGICEKRKISTTDFTPDTNINTDTDTNDYFVDKNVENELGSESDSISMIDNDDDYDNDNEVLDPDDPKLLKLTCTSRESPYL